MKVSTDIPEEKVIAKFENIDNFKQIFPQEQLRPILS